jgi:hypothetical protein
MSLHVSWGGRPATALNDLRPAWLQAATRHFAIRSSNRLLRGRDLNLRADGYEVRYGST